MHPHSHFNLSDEELEELCRPRTWERALWFLAITASLLIGVGAGVAAGFYLRAIGRFLIVFVAILVALGFWTALRTLYGLLPLETGRKELAFRRWRAAVVPLAPPDRLVEWTRRLMGNAQAPDWLLVLQGHALPDGGSVCVRVSIHLDRPDSSTLVTRTTKEVWSPVSAPASKDDPVIQRPLSPPEQAELTSRLAAFPGSFKSFPRWEVKDGFPCDLVIARRSPPLDTHLSFNLAVRAHDTQELSIELANRLLHIGRDGQEDLLVGMTDREGNTTSSLM